jgi:transposase
VTTYSAKKDRYIHVPKKSISINFGINHQLTLSAGIVVDYAVKIPTDLRRLYKNLAGKMRGSNNYRKTLTKIQKQFALWTSASTILSINLHMFLQRNIVISVIRKIRSRTGRASGVINSRIRILVHYSRNWQKSP